MTDDKPRLLSQEFSESLRPMARRMWLEDLARQVAEDEASWPLLHGDASKPGEPGFDAYLAQLDAECEQAERGRIVFTLDTLDKFYSSSESLHMEADRFVLEAVHPEIRAAYERLKARVGFCYEHDGDEPS